MKVAALRPKLGAFRTIRNRMLFGILTVAIPIYAGALYLSYHSTAQRLEAQAERDADELAARLASELDSVIRPIEGGIRTVAGQLEEIDPPREEYSRRIRAILAAWPEVYGSTIAVATASSAGNTSTPFAPYYYRGRDGIRFADLADARYSYADLPWFRRAADSQAPVWSTPYFDAGGGEAWMVTYSVPFFRKLDGGRKVMAGVITADLDLGWLNAAAARTNPGSFEAGWLVAPPGDRSFVARLGNGAARTGADGYTVHLESIRGFGEAMRSRGITFSLLPTKVFPQPEYLAVRSLQTLDWRLMLIVSRASLLAEARAVLARQIWLGLAGLALLIAAISIVAGRTSRPIHALATVVGKTQEGSFDFELPETTRRDEVGVLTNALRRMRDSLHDHIQLRAVDLAAKARLEHELQIAADIQQSMLPSRKQSPSPRFRIGAALQPAKQVGGDLYDHLELGEDRLLVIIGDVSDKGIPAAFFMARLAAKLRILGGTGTRPDELLAQINGRLVERNETCMFATVGCGVLDASNGRLIYASAGHDPPLIRNAEGTVRTVPVENGPAIGIEADARYPLAETFLAPGDTLLLFTDGVTEAVAHDGSQFGIERLSALLCDRFDDPETLVRTLVQRVGAHAPDYHATDDLTVLAVELTSGIVTYSQESMHWLIEADVSEAGMRRAQESLQSILAARVVDAEVCRETALIAEELLTNILKGGTVPAIVSRVTIDCALPPGELVLTFRDDGPQFDPLAHPTPDLEADIADRSVGGLGIHLVRELAERCDYRREEAWNVFEVRMRR